jgi:hypothetical protein
MAFFFTITKQNIDLYLATDNFQIMYDKLILLVKKYAWGFYWILFSILLINSILFNVNEIKEESKIMGFIRIADHAELFMPANNLIENGFYSIDGKTPFLSRIPEICIFYLPFRFFLSHNNAVLCVILLQLVLATVLLNTIWKYFSKNAGMTTLIILFSIVLILPYRWLLSATPEALSFVFIGFGVFYYKKWFGNNSSLSIKQLMLIGFFFSLAAILRGFLLPSAIVFLGVLWLIHRDSHNLSLVRYSLVFLPFLIYFSFWLGRNFLHEGAVVLQKNQRGFQNKYKPLVQDVKTWLYKMGFQTVEFYPNSPVDSFLNRKSPDCEPIFGPVETETYKKYNIDIDKVRLLKKNVCLSLREFNPSLEQEAFAIIKDLESQLSVNNSMITLKVINPVKQLSNSLLFNFTSDWSFRAWNESHIISKFLRIIIRFIFYIFILYFFFNSLILITRNRKEQFKSSGPVLLFMFIGLAVNAILLNQIEFKYYLYLFIVPAMMILFKTKESIIKRDK